MKLRHALRDYVTSHRPNIRHILAVPVGICILFGIAEARALHNEHEAHALLANATPQAIMSDPAKLELAMHLGQVTYAGNCAACHGDHLQGDPTHHAPALNDEKWLFGGQDIETFTVGPADIAAIIRHGIRANAASTAGSVRMPGRGAGGNLSDSDIADVAAYVLKLAHRPAEHGDAVRGEKIYLGRGGCYDCHAEDGKGDPSIGAADLTDADSWLYGADYRSVHQTIQSGRQGSSPAFEGRLSEPEIVSTAIYVYRHGV